MVDTDRGDQSEPRTLRPATMFTCTSHARRVPPTKERGRLPDIERLRCSRSTVAITGGPGTSRTALLREIAGPLEVTLIDAADLATEGEQAWIERMVDLVLTHEGVLGIENVEHLPAAQQSILGRILTGTAARARLMITAAPGTGASPSLTSLLAHCVDRVDL